MKPLLITLATLNESLSSVSESRNRTNGLIINVLVIRVIDLCLDRIDIVRGQVRDGGGLGEESGHHQQGRGRQRRAARRRQDQLQRHPQDKGSTS